MAVVNEEGKRNDKTLDESSRLGSDPDFAFPLARKMGAYKYIGELYKKKQSDVLRFLLRVRCVTIVFDLRMPFS